jgi:bifunctional DNase/RNase
MHKMMAVEIWTIIQTDEGSAVLLRPLMAEVAVPIFIGQLEAQSIMIGFGDVVVPRPLTHDLMLVLLQNLGIELARVEINEIKDNTFYARLIFRGRGFAETNPLILDSRPSDALALAVRCKCPVFVDEQVIATTGIPVNTLVEQAADRTGGEQKPRRVPRDPAARNKAPKKTGAAPGAAGMSRREALQAELDGAVAAEAYERAAEIRDMLLAMDKKTETEGPGG